MNKLIALLKSRRFWWNLVAVVFWYVLLILGGQQALKVITNHGDVREVPSVKGLTFEAAQAQLANIDLEAAILDSSIHFARLAKGQVLKQYPDANMTVKLGRVVMLTINKHRAEKVFMPKVIERTLRRASMDIQSKGLVIGDIRLVPDMASGVVLGAEHKGKPIAAGDPIRKGSTINLVAGQRQGAATLAVPNLMRLSQGEAMALIRLSGLSIGNVSIDSSMGSPRVIRQEPQASGGMLVLTEGDQVHLWLEGPNND